MTWWLTTCLLLMLGCTCSPPRVDCSTPEKCAAAECVNSGCRFDDAGNALPSVRLGAEPEPIPEVKPVTVRLGETKITTLTAAPPKSVSACTQDGLGAIFHLTVTERTSVNLQVRGKEQLGLGVVSHADFKSEFLHCQRGYDPNVQGLELTPGKWVIVVSGQGKVQLKVARETPPTLVTLNASAGGPLTKIEIGKPIKVRIGTTTVSPSKGPCNRAPGYVYTAPIVLAESGELVTSVPMGSSSMVIGVTPSGAESPLFCTPETNPNLGLRLPEGRYDFHIESKNMLTAEHIKNLSLAFGKAQQP